MMFARAGEVRAYRNRWAVLLSAPLVITLAFLPVALAQRFAVETLGLTGQGLLNLLLPVGVTLALAGSLIIINQVVPGREPTADSRPVIDAP
jgi:hypothetical protein